ncbi:c-di-AMP phosphodiesterase, consists of a GGDEF-like and DHH domains [Thermoactinomyces sp. DSM 45891]|uniref:DHH family phosphoesterase n=1 Tax=Thermoactinomyces sp. DSM 45891 TaxID=1761907 RepID=UPI00091C512D|nr:DHH family phosphoesterase [Thermoactinomyces sp. DSM 45891]SFX30742.1 c-di-AMP phosphodiesterase, consists of a GGDEF-like and DHH domains [Thermoactinomyces sp. DSM 45891]
MPKNFMHRWLSVSTSWILGLTVILLIWILTEKLSYVVIAILCVGLLTAIRYKTEFEQKKEQSQYVLALTDRIQFAGQLAVKHLPIGMILLNHAGEVQWHNPFVSNLFPKARLIGSKIAEHLPELDPEEHSLSDPVMIQIHDKHYSCIYHRAERLYLIEEVTKWVSLQEKYEDEKPILGFLHLDNIDEAGQGLSDQEETLLISKVFQAISEWALQYEVALKRIDTDKMFFIMFQKNLERMIHDRFDILDTVREMTRNNKIPITLSLGVASLGETLVEKSKHAQAALEVALARGGDQAAVQSKEKIAFFGGKTNAVEKRNRVKARVISHAISNLLQDCERVIVMGHKQPDLDAIGAAIGVVKLAELNDCEAFIILDDDLSAVQKLMDEIEKHEEVSDVFITSDQAIQWIDDPDTLLVLVDTHKPSLVTEKKLIDRAEKVVVIDHHRRGEDFVEDSVLVYLEPYASSTCELVTELLQYQDHRLTMDTLEASALLSGIVVDTKNFSVRSGSRTFEAAAFLRRHGADLMLVQSLLKEDLSQFVKRAELIRNTELHQGKIAIAVGDESRVYDQLLIAQAANTLLDMQGISASFVIAYKAEGVVSISARSEGDLNVQLIMEQMGGGGHLTHAACQPENKSVRECKQILKSLIQEQLEGEETS